MRDSYETAVFLTDQHIPFQNKEVHEISLDYVRDTQPKYIIFGGDIIDNPGMSVFDPDPNYKRNTQEEIDEAVEYIQRYKDASPDSNIVILPGNHDVARLERTKSLNTLGMKSLRANNWSNLIKESANHHGYDFGDINIIDKQYWAQFTLAGDNGILFCHGDPRMDSRIFGGKTGFRRTAQEHPFNGDVMYGHQHQTKMARSTHRGRSVHVVAGMLDPEKAWYNHQTKYDIGFAVIHYNPQVRPKPVVHVQNLTMAPNNTMLIDGKEYRA